MRIRKRPLPFLLPEAPSDPLPNLNRPLPVPVAAHAHHDRRIGAANGRDSLPHAEEKRAASQEFLSEDRDDDDDIIRKENISSAQTVGEFHPKSSPKQHPTSSQEAPVLPKKRSRPKSVKKSGNNDRSDDGEIESSAGRKKPAPALMEGSRCSRVNGRGWRCCQQTLVGYSLCEHHLGKGRLRSMANVRASTSSLPAAEETRDNDRPKAVKKKTMKLGMVKARSMSSLLGQTQTSNGSGVSPTVDQDLHNR